MFDFGRIRRIMLSVLIGLVLLLGAWAVLEMGGRAEAAPLAAPLSARSPLAVTRIVRTGVTDTLAAANVDGNSFPNNGKVFLEVANGSAGTITLTFVTPGTFLGLAIEDLTVSLTAGTTKLIGPFRPSLFNQISGADKGSVYVNYSAAADVTVAAWGLY